MNKNKMKPIKSKNSVDEPMSEDEEAASPAASEEDEELGEEEEEQEEEEEEEEEDEEEDKEEEEEEEQEDKEMHAEENSASGDALDGNKSTDRHPYPTPPPDDEAKMAPLDVLVKTKPKIKLETAKRKVPFLTLAIMAIEKLKERSGSSVMAIMKYLKENGHPWEDEKRQVRSMNKALKMGVTNGQLEMVKRSFKLTEATKKASMAVEKMKAKKAKQLAKEKEKEKLKMAKAEEKAKKKAAKKDEKAAKKAAIKKEKSGKPSERKTNQAHKKKKAEDGAKDVPPKAKTAASVAARALLNTPTNAEEPPKKMAKTKAKDNSSLAGKSKKPRKSIGTLAQTKAPMPNVKAVKKLVAAKAMSIDDGDTGGLSEAQATSTPQAAVKGKRKRKL